MDRPGFQRVEGARDEMHRRYYGGRVVDLVFYLVDAWLGGRLHPRRLVALLNRRFHKVPMASEAIPLRADRYGPV